MVRLHRAAWVLPIDRPPLRNGWVATDHGRIVGVGGEEPHAGLNEAAILPGLVNAHTHLEFSWARGLLAPAPSMAQWIRALVTLRRGDSPPEAVQRQAAAEAVSAARASGTVAFGDIGNTFVAAEVLAEAGMPAVFFHELIGFASGGSDARATEAADAVIARVRPPVEPGLAPHAPYTVSPDLFRAIWHQAEVRGLRSSVHVGESPEEIEFLMTGSGDIADTLKQFGAWNDAWTPPRSDPAEYLDRLGVLGPGLLVVHATQLKPPALARVAERGCVIVCCPRSNRWVGVGDPPIDDFYASGAPVAFGTDSLASAPDLDMFAELAAARALSSVPAARLLESATLIGARALGLESEFGSIARGKRAALIAVRVPPDVDDVEEYLVGGVPPKDVIRLEG